MRKIILLLIVCICFSCLEQEADSNRNQTVLISNVLDVNSDGEADFELNSVELSTRDIPSSFGERFLKFEPIGDNSILYQPNISSSLFLKPGDIIKKEDTDTEKWSQFGVSLISKKRVYETYDELWSVKSDLNEFYLGIKLKNDNIGWVKLDFDLETGQVYLLDSFVSNSSELIIKK